MTFQRLLAVFLLISGFCSLTLGFGLEVANQSLSRYSDSAAATAYSVPIDFNHGQYAIDVAFGTPPQWFTLAISLHTATSWVPDKTCIPHQFPCPKYCAHAGQFEALLTLSRRAF